MLRSLDQRIKRFMLDERGDFSIKGLAITVGVIVVVGAVVVWLSGGQMTNWIEDIWDSLGGWLDTTIGLGW